MTFTPAEIRLLALSDSLTTGSARIAPRRNVGGRPRKVSTSESIALRRARWRRYEDKKHDRLNAFGLPRKKGGRPKTKPSTPAQQRRRLRALTRYYANKTQSGEMR
jgi:hypothetical protein